MTAISAIAHPSAAAHRQGALEEDRHRLGEHRRYRRRSSRVRVKAGTLMRTDRPGERPH